MSTPPNVTNMNMRSLVVLWQNALQVVNAPRSDEQRTLAKRIIRDVNAEWKRRRYEPGFNWPTTEVSGTKFKGLETENWTKSGLLSSLGYEVGLKSSGNQQQREALLAGVFECVVPPVFTEQYVKEWGSPRSSGRLQKMAETIAALARNARRRTDANMDAAIKDWVSDLEFLYYTYYVGHFSFAWPKTKLP